MVLAVVIGFSALIVHFILFACFLHGCAVIVFCVLMHANITGLYVKSMLCHGGTYGFMMKLGFDCGLIGQLTCIWCSV